LATSALTLDVFMERQIIFHEDRLIDYFLIQKRKTMTQDKIRNAKNFDELLDIKYGKTGSKKRENFEEKAQYFVISEILKEARKEANMTQE
jgi:hypothetical protein